MRRRHVQLVRKTERGWKRRGRAAVSQTASRNLTKVQTLANERYARTADTRAHVPRPPDPGELLNRRVYASRAGNRSTD